jgi:hypothetical protein
MMRRILGKKTLSENLVHLSLKDRPDFHTEHTGILDASNATPSSRSLQIHRMRTVQKQRSTGCRSSLPDHSARTRGQIIAISGKSGGNTELANYPHNHFRLTYGRTVTIDPYALTFKMTSQYSGYHDLQGGAHWVSSPIESSPNMENHWTKSNDPQCSEMYSTSASGISPSKATQAHHGSRSAVLTLFDSHFLSFMHIQRALVDRPSTSCGVKQWLLYS